MLERTQTHTMGNAVHVEKLKPGDRGFSFYLTYNLVSNFRRKWLELSNLEFLISDKIIVIFSLPTPQSHKSIMKIKQDSMYKDALKIIK